MPKNPFLKGATSTFTVIRSFFSWDAGAAREYRRLLQYNEYIRRMLSQRGENLPMVIHQQQTLPMVIHRQQTLPMVIRQTQTLPMVIRQTQTLPMVRRSGGSGGHKKGVAPWRPWLWMTPITMLAMASVWYRFRKPMTHDQVGVMTNAFARKGAGTFEQLMNTFVGTLPSKTVQDEALLELMSAMRAIHAKAAPRGMASSDEALDDSFSFYKDNLGSFLRIINGQLTPDAPMFEAQLSDGDEHVYGMALRIPGDAYQTMTPEEVLLLSARQFPNGFKVLEQEGGIGGMPNLIELAGGDMVHIKDGVRFKTRNGGTGAVYHFRTGRRHALEGSLYHGVVQLPDGSTIIFRFGIGKAPALQGAGRGVLDRVNNTMGPFSWFLADLKALGTICGGEEVGRLLQAHEGPATIRSYGDFLRAYERMAVLANYGGAFSRNVGKEALEILRALQDEIRPMASTQTGSDSTKSL